MAGGDPGRPVVVLLLRAPDAVEGAQRIRRALEAAGRSPAAVDLGSGGGCESADGHGTAGGSPPPPLRVVRVAAAGSDLPGLEEAILAAGGLERVGGAVMGGPAEGEVWWDLHVWGR